MITTNIDKINKAVLTAYAAYQTASDNNFGNELTTVGDELLRQQVTRSHHCTDAQIEELTRLNPKILMVSREVQCGGVHGYEMVIGVDLLQEILDQLQILVEEV